MVKLNKGIFSFLSRHGLNIHQMRAILYQYALTKEIGRPKKGRSEWYAEISEKAQEDFKAFKKCYNKHKPTRVFQAYEDWWDSCNTDGTFAYNGITEDF